MPTAAEKDLYAVLGLPQGADDRRIKDAYRRLAKSYHPDVNRGDASSAERFKEIAAAYRILSDPVLRAEYIARRRADCGSVFVDHLRRQQAKSAARKPPPVADPSPAQNIAVKLHLTLEELAKGVTRKIKIKRRVRCSVCKGTGWESGDGDVCATCKGSGKVSDPTAVHAWRPPLIACRRCGGTGKRAKAACVECLGQGYLEAETAVNVTVPRGADQGSCLLVQGLGHEGVPGDPCGDLRVIVAEKEHPFLKRVGADLIYSCRITLTQWLEGCTLPVPALEEKIALKLAPGLKPEGRLKIRGRGMPRPDGSYGDLLVEYRLCVPRQLNRKQQSLLKRLEATPGFRPGRDDD